ncbi:MAG: carboxypeptidase-like regulatory domain-containing protein, partial [Bryobacteraceae bacterium]
MSKSTLAVSSLSVLLLLWAPAARTQTVAVAEVSGTVTDPTGAAIAGAAVTMTETDKRVVRSTVTDSLGNYALPELPVGPYRLEVRASGFKDHVESGLVLEVANNIQVNVAMQVGSVNETVEVKANADLPLDGRQATQLILTLGASSYGDAGDTGSKTFWSSTRISVAGGQGNGTAYLLDGGDNTDAMSNVNMPFPFPDALQEFSVDTNAVSSRFGTHPGATVNAVTKSGSNAFHGDLFEYIRNGDMDARNFFAPVHDSLKRNQFGGTGGGKIITDKLFFFGGYQGTRNRSNPPQSIAYIPTEAALDGDFSTLAGAGCQSSGKALTLKDPSTGTPYPGNIIPQTDLNPVAIAMASKYLPVSSATDCGKVTYGIPVTGDEDQLIGRVDYVQSA